VSRLEFWWLETRSWTLKEKPLQAAQGEYSRRLRVEKRRLAAGATGAGGKLEMLPLLAFVPVIALSLLRFQLWARGHRHSPG